MFSIKEKDGRAILPAQLGSRAGASVAQRHGQAPATGQVGQYSRRLFVVVFVALPAGLGVLFRRTSTR